MKLSDFTPKAQQLWSTWDIRGFVLLSLLIQCLLVSCASEKKRTNKGWLVNLIFAAYYLADWIAPYTIAMMYEKHGSSKSYDPGAAVIMSFWVNFLLLHLGGPDNVTSLSNEDNQMWRRTFYTVWTHVLPIIYIYYRSLPNNPLFLASLLVFVAGIIRSAERIISMFFATLQRWRYGTITLVKQHDFEKLFETQLAMIEANLPTQVESMQLPRKKFQPRHRNKWDVELEFDSDNKKLDGKSLLQFAKFFYHNFRGLFTDHVSYCDEQRQFTRDFFLRRSGHDAFKLAEIELSFLHEDLHTKAATRVPAMRMVTIALVATASHSFYSFDKRGWSKIDIGISYVLLFGSFVLEIISLLMTLFSGRYVNAINYCNLVNPIANAIVNMPMWSKCFSKSNLICYCLRHRNPLLIKTIPQIIHCWFLHEVMKLKLKRTFTSDKILKSLKDIIYGELCTRSELAHNIETATMICSQRGDWALMQWSCYSKLKWSLGEVEYGQSLLLWHIATDLLCYDTNDNDDDTLYSKPRFCKEISEYLLYLLLVKPIMIAPVAGNWVKTFWDTSLEAERLFHRRSITDHKQACQAILSVDTDIKPVVLKGDASASVLFDACRLAKQLSEIEVEKRWSLMSKVWMELLTYAAFHCEGTVHAENPSQGGELLTFVWLLMNHLGLGMQFREEPERTRYSVVLKN